MIGVSRQLLAKHTLNGSRRVAPVLAPCASAITTSLSTTATLPPILPPTSPPMPLSAIPEKGLASRVWDRYSIPEQQRKIRIAEAFYQAATIQSADP